MALNPWNAIVHAGHGNGTVTCAYHPPPILPPLRKCKLTPNGTVWSPNSSEPLVKLLCHKGPVKSLAVDREGRYMVSCGNDRKMAVWDIRMFRYVPLNFNFYVSTIHGTNILYREVNSYFTRTPASSVSISDRGVTAVGWSTSVTLWKDLFVKHRIDQIKVESPYMTWGGEGKSVSTFPLLLLSET